MKTLTFVNVELVINGMSWSKFGTTLESFKILAKENTEKRFYRIISKTNYSK